MAKGKKPNESPAANSIFPNSPWIEEGECPQHGAVDTKYGVCLKCCPDARHSKLAARAFLARHPRGYVEVG